MRGLLRLHQGVQSRAVAKRVSRTTVRHAVLLRSEKSLLQTIREWEVCA
jgi:hypothetical protein